jgi:hypothetical protein
MAPKFPSVSCPQLQWINLCIDSWAAPPRLVPKRDACFESKHLGSPWWEGERHLANGRQPSCEWPRGRHSGNVVRFSDSLAPETLLYRLQPNTASPGFQ